MNTQELQDQIAQLQYQLGELTARFNKNNFTAQQDFTKYCNFTGRVKLPIYTSLPTCEVGEICVYSTSGTYNLMIATAKDTWTIVGTQV